MSDTAYPVLQHYGTNAQRLAFTPAPAAGTQPLYIWYETDTDNYYIYTTAWKGPYATGGGGTVTTTGSPASGNLTKFSGATSITNGDLSGDVTTSGTLAATIANNAVTTAKINNSAVTLAKIANAAANSKLLGSGASGSGSAYAELTLGTGLSMSGTTLNASAVWTRIAQTVTSGSQATVDFSGISGSYSELKVVFVAQDTQAGSSDVVVFLKINGDATSGNYTSTQRSGGANGANVVNTVAATANGGQSGAIPQSGTTSAFGTGEVSLIGYASTGWHKMVRFWTCDNTTSGNGAVFQGTFKWKSTAAITQLTFTAGGTAFTDGSIFTLYGLL